MDVQSVRDARQKGVVWFTRFCSDKKHHGNCLFCFFEGEDRKYYCSRIEKYTDYDFEHIVCYDCGGRENVEEAYRLISQKTEYDYVKKAFFVDHDFCSSSIASNNEVYETPCYSIENLYVSTTAFSRILVREFGINSIDDDYRKCINDYINRMAEYNNSILFFNAWLSCQRKKGMRSFAVRLSDFKIVKNFNCITIERINVKTPIDLSFLQTRFPDACCIDPTELNREIATFEASDKEKIFRGKFELECMRRILLSMLEHNRNGTYFSEVRKSVSIDPNSNALSALGEYADTPECLVAFLQQYKK